MNTTPSFHLSNLRMQMKNKSRYGCSKNKLDLLKEMRHIEMPKAAPKKSICHFQKLVMILK